jgi:hypothetical protein
MLPPLTEQAAQTKTLVKNHLNALFFDFLQQTFPMLPDDVAETGIQFPREKRLLLKFRRIFSRTIAPMMAITACT